MRCPKAELKIGNREFEIGNRHVARVERKQVICGTSIFDPIAPDRSRWVPIGPVLDCRSRELSGAIGSYRELAAGNTVSYRGLELLFAETK
jgi:hypothetical protein